MDSVCSIVMGPEGRIAVVSGVGLPQGTRHEGEEPLSAAFRHLDDAGVSDLVPLAQLESITRKTGVVNVFIFEARSGILSGKAEWVEIDDVALHFSEHEDVLFYNGLKRKLKLLKAYNSQFGHR